MLRRSFITSLTSLLVVPGLVQHMIRETLADAGATPPEAARKKGIAKYYAPGVFAQVARNRGIKMRGDVDGYCAVIDCSMIEQVIPARINSGNWERYQVLDCSHPKDAPRHRRDGLVIEVDYSSAVRNGFVKQGKAPAEVILP